ncbi:MAG: hypothetical protein Ta2B_27140 [Termitinemataceae bacterium]|nr:MAG: hypothetical protein Ta2B_27140 [Termitinemataceae bacterium]
MKNKTQWHSLLGRTLIKSFLVFQLFFVLNFVTAQTRSLDSIFPNLNADIKKRALEKTGFSSYTETYKNNKSPEKAKRLNSDGVSSIKFDLVPADKNINITSDVQAANPLYVFESLFIVPSSNKNLLNVYSAISQIKKLQGRTYHSVTRDKNIALFEEATRIISEKNTSPTNDPSKIYVLPKNEIFFLRVKDANFGNCYYKAAVNVSDSAIFYTLSNSKPISYLFVPVIKNGKFIIKMYIEPVTEGFMIYAVTGIDASEFVTKNVNIPSAIQKRLDVIYTWIIDGIDGK